MSMFGGEGLPGGFHKDVMDANPTDAASKKTLCEEIKNRAKGSLASKNYLEARTLYSKAIAVMEGSPEAAYSSILHANRSMCELGMNRGAEAETDAARALELDPTYVKAYYRRGMALSKLGRWADARDVLQQGLQLKADDKDMRAQLDKAVFALSNPDGSAQKAAAPAAPRARATVSTRAGATTSAPPADARRKTGPPPAARAPTRPEKAEADEEDEEDSTVYRGYKTTSDGRTTTFFNNELDAKTKRLIGDIAPKKLEVAPQAEPAPAPAEQGSAWNAAGTFESKDLTPWARARLAELAQTAQCTAAGAVIKVTSCAVTGDGEVVAARGKRKHIYDFTAVLKWSLTTAEGSAGVVNGEITVRDIDADEDGAYEVGDFKVQGAPSPEQLAVVASLVQSGSAGLQPQVFAQLDAFRREFKAK